ncbi:uncharacterized protein METZ01_LOCUS324562 [marine metagenome]|uniref:Uncharacterized protein n=1 Tax=marine metagenome TaxID=408172 RepID=A0A382PG75_9ZZZZ
MSPCHINALEFLGISLSFSMEELKWKKALQVSRV